MFDRPQQSTYSAEHSICIILVVVIVIITIIVRPGTVSADEMTLQRPGRPVAVDGP